ncbi:MAG: hypothetical protein HRU20_32530, partial [Pseudomonadales bacterium]|nr:hypothetical protein [Pseudomonadales bacterium]
MLDQMLLLAQADPKAFIGKFSVLLFLSFFITEAVFGRLRNKAETWRDISMMCGGILMHFLFTGLTISALVALEAKLFPQSVYMFKQVSIWLTLPVIVLLNELGHYWIHRMAHKGGFLCK